MNEIWTAKEKKEDNIIFDVESNGETKEVVIEKGALPQMFVEGGCHAMMGAMLAIQPLPWRFRKVNGQIYLDGPSVGVPNYHPIAPGYRDHLEAKDFKDPGMYEFLTAIKS